MKVSGLAICPPAAAADNPKATPEILASALAKYSRSNKGIDHILAGIDWSAPDKAVDAIFKFVDYGHASISGLTGGIAMTIDGCSMLLAYKLFEFAQLGDGQESSTRYIKMDASSLPSPDVLGLPTQFASEWLEIMQESFSAYKQIYSKLDDLAKENPSVVKVPPQADQKTADRLRKNYALDRARYLIPLATKTNVALVMTARVWAQTIKILDSMPLTEAVACASALRSELEKFAPRLIKHSYQDTAEKLQQEKEIEHIRKRILSTGVPIEQLEDKVFVSIQRDLPDFLPDAEAIGAAFTGKRNRYSTVGNSVRRIFVRFAWNNIALAELRDLNRHRTGHRFSPLTAVGFYLPPEIERKEVSDLLTRQAKLVKKLAENDASGGSFLYAYLLGTQTPFEHSTQADKFIYEVELRTGLGAHFRYAQHLEAVCHEFNKLVPEAAPFIQIGTAEPE
jgi:thymidylate synthase ThyX